MASCRWVALRKVLLSLSLCVSCSDGEEQGLEETGPLGGSSSDDTPAKNAPSFKELYEKVFVPAICTDSACHGLEQQGGRLDMRNAEIAFESLVGISAEGPECISTTIVRVEPGLPNKSLLYSKLFMEHVPCGRLMPPTALILPDEDLELVHSWILAGANWESVTY